jgi:hypothetical protein
VQPANSSRSLRSSAQRILACRPGMLIAIVLFIKNVPQHRYIIQSTIRNLPPRLTDKLIAIFLSVQKGSRPYTVGAARWWVEGRRGAAQAYVRVGSALGGGLKGGAGLRRHAAGPAQLPNTGVDQRSGPSGSHIGRGACGGPLRRRRSTDIEGVEGPPRKVVGPALDESDHALRLARRKLNHDLVDLPVPGNKAESCRDRFRHALLCGPIGPDAIESDSVRIGGGALCCAQGCLGTEPRKSARGVKRRMCSMAGLVRSALRRKLSGPGLIRSPTCGLGDGVRWWLLRASYAPGG